MDKYMSGREMGLAVGMAHRDNLRARIASLEAQLAEAVSIVERKDATIDRLREALRYYADKEYDSRSMSDSMIQYVADEVLNHPRREEPSDE